jgi:hypothetical protein
LLRDAGSRSGTWLAGLRVDGEVPLAGEGRLRPRGRTASSTLRLDPGACDSRFRAVMDRGAVPARLRAEPERRPRRRGAGGAPLLRCRTAVPRGRRAARRWRACRRRGAAPAA